MEKIYIMIMSSAGKRQLENVFLGVLIKKGKIHFLCKIFQNISKIVPKLSRFSGWYSLTSCKEYQQLHVPASKGRKFFLERV